MENVQTVPVEAAHSDSFYFLSGIAFLAMAKAKHLISGYKTPKPFGLDELERCVDYDLSVADNLLKSLDRYGGSIQGAHVLELGPGSDLGIGHYLIHRGAERYTAFDRHALAERVPPEFYERLAWRGINLSPEKVQYIARRDFDLSAALTPESVDVIVSNAAFEHFDDFQTTAWQLARVVKPGGKLVAVIDLQTHSRWIREQDPNNIYRYPRWLYRAFYFPGQPNRLRPADYERALERAGWSNVMIKMSTRHDYKGAVHRDFRRCNMLDACSIVLCGTR